LNRRSFIKKYSAQSAQNPQRLLQVPEIFSYVSLRANRSNPLHNKIKHFEIAASLMLLAMTARIEFVGKLVEQEFLIPCMGTMVRTPTGI